jgi:hypothetical protein
MVEEPSHVKQLSLNHVCKIGLTKMLKTDPAVQLECVANSPVDVQ